MGYREQPKTVEVECYLTIEPEWARGNGPSSKDYSDRPLLEGAKVVSLTQKRPSARQRAGTVVSRFVFEIDANAFLPLQPEVKIRLNAGDVEPIHVTADAPDPYDDPRQQPDPEEIEP